MLISLHWFEIKKQAVRLNPDALIAVHGIIIFCSKCVNISAFSLFCAAALPRYPTPPSEQIRGWPHGARAVKSPIFSTSSTTEDKNLRRGALLFVSPAMCVCSTGGLGLHITRSFLAGECMQNQTGTMKTVNKGS